MSHNIILFITSWIACLLVCNKLQMYPASIGSKKWHLRLFNLILITAEKLHFFSPLFFDRVKMSFRLTFWSPISSITKEENYFSSNSQKRLLFTSSKSSWDESERGIWSIEVTSRTPTHCLQHCQNFTPRIRHILICPDLLCKRPVKQHLKFFRLDTHI